MQNLNYISFWSNFCDKFSIILFYTCL